MKSVQLVLYSCVVFSSGVVVGNMIASTKLPSENSVTLNNHSASNKTENYNLANTDTLDTFQSTHYASGHQINVNGIDVQNLDVTGNKGKLKATLTAQQSNKIKARLTTLIENEADFSAIEHLMNQLAEDDAAEAIAWLDKMPASETSNALYYPVLRAYIQQDLQGAGEFIAQINDQTLQAELSMEYVAALATQDLAQAIDWSSALSNASLSQAMQLQAIQATINADPLNALEHLTWVNMEADNQEAQTVVAHAAYQLSENNVQAAIDQLTIFPDNLQPQMAYGIMSHWSSSDKAAALQWMNTLALGKVKDKAIQSYIEHSYHQADMPLAFSLAEEITDPQLRKKIIASVYHDWQAFEPELAKVALNNIDELEVSQKLDLLCE